MKPIVIIIIIVVMLRTAHAAILPLLPGAPPSGNKFVLRFESYDSCSHPHATDSGGFGLS